MIYLYDASAIICSATLSKQKLKNSQEHRGDFNYYSFPTAGIYQLLSYIVTDLKRKKLNDSIVVAFDCHFNDNIRRYYYPDYKRKRIKYPELGQLKDNMTLKDIENLVMETYPIKADEHPNKFKERVSDIVRDVVKQRAIQIQKRIVKWMLKEIGVVVAEHPQLEADDLIYSVCSKYGETEKIFLRADDGDLFDCISYAPNLTMQSVKGDGTLSPRSGVIYNKIFHGDLKDGVYSLYSSIQKDKLDRLDIAIRRGTYDTSILDSYDQLVSIGFTEEEAQLIIKNNYLKTPKIVDVDACPVTYNHQQLEKMFSIFGFDSLLNRIDGKRYTGLDMQDIHKKVYSILPIYVKEWYYSRRYALNKSEEIYSDTLETYETSKVISNMDEIIDALSI